LKKTIFWLLFFINAAVYAQETDNEEYNTTGTAEGLTIYGEQAKEFASGSMEAFVLERLNGTTRDRKRFIETEFLEESGFRRTGNVKYRKTSSSEKALSVWHGAAGIIPNGIASLFGLKQPIPVKPFSEIDIERLPKGRYYSFESVFVKSKFNSVSQDVWNIMKLEYMLQIEFNNGIIIKDNLNYYTDENINKFDDLIQKLPASPGSVMLVKARFQNELKKIKRALERYRNPGEDYLRALRNLK
jgi:hypothetical protein